MGTPKVEVETPAVITCRCRRATAASQRWEIAGLIAETGTLILTVQPGQMRSVSVLPTVHVALARTSQIMATLANYLVLAQAAGSNLQQHLSVRTMRAR
jgi:L-lactate utilization protein LutC